MKVLLGIIVGMLFMHSLTGEYFRYGRAVNDQIQQCERNVGQECDILVSPVSNVVIDDVEIDTEPTA